MTRWIGIVALVVGSLTLSAPPASAAFPGANGVIAYDQPLSRFPVQIRTIEPDGSGTTLLTTDGSNGNPDWSSDGTEIAFVHADASGSTWEIDQMAADGTGVSTILSSFNPRFGIPTSPTWSPDGTEIAFCAFGGHGTRVFTVNADGSGRANVSGTHQDCDPEWSPDGSRLAITTFTTHGAFVVTMDVDGADRSRLTAGTAPDWSPDGSTIVFVQPGDETDIATIGADGTGLTDLTFTANRSESSPAYSPDGTKIVFSQHRTAELGSTSDLWTMDADGLNLLQITDTRRRDEADGDWQPT
jgi:Tol biopolymer transport system component